MAKLNPKNLAKLKNALFPKAAPAAVGAGLLGQSEDSEAGVLNQVPRGVQAIGELARDIRFDPRKLEQERLNNLTIQTEDRPLSVPEVKMSQFEGKPFITTMSDRTRAGAHLTGINNTEFSMPVNLQGGQDFMFENPYAWASAPGVVKQMKKAATQAKDQFGEDPLFIPWRMAPTGSDFSKMTGETMTQFASANMNKRNKRSLDSKLKKMIPDWPGVDSPDSVFYWRNASDKVRKAAKNMMDKEFRDKGGLSVGEARMAIADPSQLNAREGGIQSIGQVDTSKPIVTDSGHPSYPGALPGEGIGRVSEDIGIFELLGQGQRDIPDLLNPGQTDIRALQMKPYSGVIDETVLKRLQDRGVDVGNIDPKLLALMAGGSATAASVPVAINQMGMPSATEQLSLGNPEPQAYAAPARFPALHGVANAIDNYQDPTGMLFDTSGTADWLRQFGEGGNPYSKLMSAFGAAPF